MLREGRRRTLTTTWTDTAFTTPSTGTGSPDSMGHDWEGMNYADEQGDRIGMLLDLDQGSMTVWKNNESTLYSTL